MEINKEEKEKEEHDLSNELNEKEFIEINEDISKALIEMKKEKDNSEENIEEEEKELKNIDIGLFSSNNSNSKTNLDNNSDNSKNSLKDNKIEFDKNINNNNINNNFNYKLDKLNNINIGDNCNSNSHFLNENIKNLSNEDSNEKKNNNDSNTIKSFFPKYNVDLLGKEKCSIIENINKSNINENNNNINNNNDNGNCDDNNLLLKNIDKKMVDNINKMISEKMGDNFGDYNNMLSNLNIDLNNINCFSNNTNNLNLNNNVLNNINNINNNNIFFSQNNFNQNYNSMLMNNFIDNNINYKNLFSPINSFSEGKNQNQINIDISKNVINLENILKGKDKRTTLIIRNIPIRYSISLLIKELNNKFCRKFDVVYLPQDYTNNFNLGFGFINFIEPFHLISFCEKYEGKKWNCFHSNKICQLAYSKYQGKNDLIKYIYKKVGISSHSNNKENLKKSFYINDDDKYPKPSIELPIKYYNKFRTYYPYSLCHNKNDKTFIVDNFYNF